jgi:hypothetical protein
MDTPLIGIIAAVAAAVVGVGLAMWLSMLHRDPCPTPDWLKYVETDQRFSPRRPGSDFILGTGILPKWEGEYRGWRIAHFQDLESLTPADDWVDSNESVPIYTLTLDIETELAPIAVVSNKKSWCKWVQRRIPEPLQSVSVEGRDFQRKYLVLAREPNQARQIIDSAVRAALLKLPSACIHVDGKRMVFNLLVQRDVLSPMALHNLAAGFAKLRPAYSRGRIDVWSARVFALFYRNLDIVFDCLILLAEHMGASPSKAPYDGSHLAGNQTDQ